MTQSRNMIARFMKTYSHKPIKILQSLSRGKIKKCLIFSTTNHCKLSSAYNHEVIMLNSTIQRTIFEHFIPVRLIVGWYNQVENPKLQVVISFIYKIKSVNIVNPTSNKFTANSKKETSSVTPNKRKQLVNGQKWVRLIVF